MGRYTPHAIHHKPIRIAVTGGHYTPALAVMEALEKRGNFEFYWIGHRYAFSEAGESAEYKALTSFATLFSDENKVAGKLGIPFFDLRAGKLYRVRSLREWLKIPLGILHAFYLLVKIRPRLILSFGGYLAAPVVLAGFFLRIPAVTHEQTVVSGWANRFIGLFARRIFVSWEPSLKFFPRPKTVLTGNPIRRAVFEIRTKRFRFPERLSTIYITGGKQGAHVINEAVREALSEFLERYNVIHQTGSSEAYRDYQKIAVLRNQLPKRFSRRYLVQEYFGEEEIGAVYAAADLVVARAGANTVAELAALGKPVIFIPIPWASHDEQMKNAQLLEQVGSAAILPQEKLSSSSLLMKIEKMVGDLEHYREKGKEAKKLVDLSAAAKIAAEIAKMIS